MNVIIGGALVSFDNQLYTLSVNVNLIVIIVFKTCNLMSSWRGSVQFNHLSFTWVNNNQLDSQESKQLTEWLNHYLIQ